MCWSLVQGFLPSLCVCVCVCVYMWHINQNRSGSGHNWAVGPQKLYNQLVYVPLFWAVALNYHMRYVQTSFHATRFSSGATQCLLQHTFIAKIKTTLRTIYRYYIACMKRLQNANFYNCMLQCFFFFFFLLGPVSIDAPVCTAAFEVYCAALNTRFSPDSTASASYKEAEVLYCGCTNVCWFNRQAPKDIIALASQCLAVARNMLYCFYLLPAESAGWIPFWQTIVRRCFPTRACPVRIATTFLSWCLPNLSRSSAIFLHGSAAMFNYNRYSLHSAVRSSRYSLTDTTVTAYSWVVSSLCAPPRRVKKKKSLTEIDGKTF
jgi:hypothetical protein